MSPKHYLPSTARIDGGELAKLIDGLPDKPDMKDYEALLSKLREIISALEVSKKSIPPSIPASKLESLSDTALLLGVDYVANPDYSFEPKDPDLTPDLDSWLLPALTSLNAPFWRSHSAEALCRTSVDLVINSRLARLQDIPAIQRLALMAEKPISTDLPNSKQRISGDIDYVVGYGGNSNRFESSLIVVEAKRPSTFSGGTAQCLAYLVGLRQSREGLIPARMSTKVYGIVSDGIIYMFMRLEGNRLTKSRPYDISVGRDLELMINMLDGVLLSALHSTPHTTPNKTFPVNSTQLHAKDKDIFTMGGGSDVFQQLCRVPASEYIMYDSDSDHADDSIESYDILFDTPTKTLQLRPKYSSPG